MIKRVALDIDDVLAGFYPGMCKRFFKPFKKVNIWDGEVECKWIVDHFSIIEDDVEFWMNLDTVSKPTDIQFEVACYLTASPKKLLDVRREWLSKAGFPAAEIICAKDKLGEMIHRKLDLLIDDKIATVNKINSDLECKQLEIRAIQFKPPYMTAECDSRDSIITNLREVNEFL